MSLPSGYKRLEYIESTGTQYIDTRVSGGTNASFEMTARLVSTNAKNNNQFFSEVANFCSVNGTSSKFRVEITNGRYVWFTLTPSIKWKLKVNSDGSIYCNDALVGTLSGIAGKGWGSSYENWVFMTASDGINYATSAELYSLKMYTDGVLVRDFVPAKRLSDNAIGLYDNVEKKFYANAGTGTFTAGPYAVPEMPERLTASVNGSFVTLTWSASNDAAGYKISRNGVQIADQTALSFTDTVDQDQTYVYTVVAYNGNGDSEPAKMTVQTPPGAPTTLYQTMAVRLAWSSVSSAERYNIYRNGKLLGTTTGLFYVDDTADENTEYTYSVSAVNSTGESSKTTITVYTKSGYFLYKPYIESATFQ